MNSIQMIMPKMGESIMEGTILKWLKKEGDHIDEDESILEIGTDKVDTEIPSIYKGKLKKILVHEGDIVQVGNPIAIIEINQDSIKIVDNIFNDALNNNFSEKIKKNKKIKKDSNKFYSPLILNIANRENISLKELDNIKGTGENQRVTKIDLLKFLEDKNIKISKPKSISKSNATEKIVLNENEELIETDRIRKIIASRMIESKQISPHVTSFVEADITDVVIKRLEIKEKFFKKHKTPISFNPIFIYCVCKAIQDFPLINISYINDKIIKKNYINIGIAVALKDDNLIVPVLKNVENMDFLTIIKKSNDLIKRTKENKLHPDELSGGTYTISNIGSFGNTMGTPIIMQPQVAILAIGTIKKVAAVVEGKNGDEIKIRNKVFLSHTYDHRIVDGALGGKFAQKVAYYIENFDIQLNLD
ncbi:MAG: dihydrolipoamide acetyltransferase family protein [Bacteroidota bacterium]|nr:dihydrolipoamide acetyltransferase family protein [Bacteroidota bacterium]